MNKNKAEQYKAYQALLETMAHSRLIQSMPLKDRNFIKMKYIHSSVEEITFATEEIIRQDKAFEQTQADAVKRIDESQQKLEEAVNEAEQYLQTK